MKPEAQLIAIAEACGWTCCGQVPGLHPHGLPPWSKISDYTTEQVINHEVPIDALPDYLGDLNAIHLAEVQVGLHRYPLRERYYQYLIEAKDKDGKDFPFWMATASQRAEALLRAIGKWRDEE
jgi:hypothetical protein